MPFASDPGASITLLHGAEYHHTALSCNMYICLYYIILYSIILYSPVEHLKVHHSVIASKQYTGDVCLSGKLPSKFNI